MLRHARLISRWYNFIPSDLTARGLHYRKEMQTIHYFNIKMIVLIVPEQCLNSFDVYSKVPAPFCSDWLQHVHTVRG
jgi:hypothetical protein